VIEIQIVMMVKNQHVMNMAELACVRGREIVSGIVSEIAASASKHQS